MRLTIRNGTAKIVSLKGEKCSYGAISYECEQNYKEAYTLLSAALKKLADYEDEEEEGMLLKLPCKEGTTVHCIGSCGEICDDYLCESCEEHKVIFTCAFDRNMIEQFGKTVFRTHDEAEIALQEMTSGN